MAELFAGAAIFFLGFIFGFGLAVLIAASRRSE